MKKIYLNNVFHLSEENVAKSKLELNMRENKNGPLHLDNWLELTEKEKEIGVSKCSYWGWYSKQQRNFQVGDLVFSFVQMQEIDEWLFISSGEVIEIPKDDYAKMKILEEYRPFFGKLIIKYKKGNTYSRYVFNLKDRLNDCVLKEILPSMYTGEKFEGFDKVNLPYGKLDKIFKGELMPTYFEALKKITGIYCLTDNKTGKLYIGSAYGSEGVAQRWGNYLNSKHGGNKKLLDLYEDKGEQYFMDNFTFTLIEYFGINYDVQKIIEREQYWKRCFNTINTGYNSN